ncbi:MAG: MarR family transcriptional regulator [Patescibacteria group bacterium]
MTKTPLTIGELIVITGIRIKTVANRFVFAPSGTTGAQFRILRMLVDGPQRPSDIMKYAGGTKSNVSQRINALEDEELVRRMPRQKGDDRRNVMVEITAKGKALVARLLAQFKKSTEAMEKQFSAKDLDEFRSFMDKLNRVIDENEKKVAQYFKGE